MGDLISRQAAVEVADAVWSVTGDKNVAKVRDKLCNLPSAQPERKMGKWIYLDRWGVFECIQCGGQMIRNIFDFCPWCGAEMEKGKSDGCTIISGSGTDQ